MPTNNILEAEKLKLEANTLHRQRQYQAAYHKYTEAIEYAPKNAILYANRAASGLAMKEYLDAAADAKKATELDPTYAKAWGRLADASQALSSPAMSENAWRTALKCLPPDAEMNDAHKVLKLQFEAGLKIAENSVVLPPERLFTIENYNKNDPNWLKMPWVRASELEPQMIGEQCMSSGFVILHAYKEFKEGIDAMKMLKKVKQTADGNTLWHGMTNAIVPMSNGLLRDIRVFHISNWFNKYNTQVELEARDSGAWTKAGPKLVKKEASQRLKKEGWSTLRRSLSITIRDWFIRGVMDGYMEHHQSACEFFQRVLEILEWGRALWHNVSKDDRGAIFELTFIRGIRKIYISTLMKRIASKDPTCEDTLEDLAEKCLNMIAKTDANPPPAELVYPVDIGFYASFWREPKGIAYSTLGWCHTQVALKAEDHDIRAQHFAKAAQNYILAAESYFVDDEYYVYFLKCALDGHLSCGTPVSTTLDLCKRIRQAIPKMLMIWRTSQLSAGRDKYLEFVLRYEATVQKRVLEGDLSLDDIATFELTPELI